MYSLFFKVQNKETKNKQPLVVKHHLALMPPSLSEALVQRGHVMMVQILATILLCFSRGGGSISEDT